METLFRVAGERDGGEAEIAALANTTRDEAKDQ